MSIITLVGCGLVVGISFIVDANGTIKLVVNAVTIRGITWIIKKVIGSMDKDKADLINFAGWSIAGVSIIGLLKNCKIGIKPIISDIGKTMETLSKIEGNIQKFSDWIDRLTPWE